MEYLMPVPRKRKPSAFLWIFLAFIALLWFGLQCYYIGMNHVFYGKLIPPASLEDHLLLAAGFIIPVLLMVLAVIKLIQTRP